MYRFHPHQPIIPDDASSADEGRLIEVRGIVQGVGFRPWVYREACEARLAGRVRNHTAGVTIEVFGKTPAVDRFVDRLATAAPEASVIDSLTSHPIPYEPTSGFHIEDSERTAERRVAIPPDLATCPACLAEMLDPDNRRYHYPFTNCTACGPRFTIATAAPYDRPSTTMATFRMCPLCQREYDSVQDRRFHAQPNACPVCGPVLTLLDGSGASVETSDVALQAVEALVDGWIVALKGIGGFHLACDATSEHAVARLRVRKRRDEKPFAVMVRDLDHARSLGVLSSADERLMMSVERPIVLVRRREPSCLASGVAPNNPLVGLFLPYSPLHHLLMEGVRRPLVMTSGNVSDEPIAYENGEAVRRLSGIADLFVTHDRDIVTRCDDSVARVINGAPVILRRSRGYVPRALRLASPLARPVLGCGALLKNAFCAARGGEAVLGPHIGDLENLETFASYRESIERLEQFLGFTPEILAHDLHPDYLSTRYALQRQGVLPIAVQHHHAHVASAMAEHGLDGPVMGVAYDGTGLGPDGTAWGGEILLARYDGFDRLATFRPLALAGGDTAIRQPWRIALALLDDAFGGDAPIEALGLFRNVSRGDVTLVRGMIDRRLNAPLAHGVGRYFDAMGAIGLERPRATYEGQLALEWNSIADSDENGQYRYRIVRTASVWQLDLRAMVRDAVYELIGGAPPAIISARFHNTLAAATADLVRGLARLHGNLPVVLSGGCFQNAVLAEGVSSRLAPDFDVRLHARVPPGDGGLALGQAVIADAIARTL
jgi:hydrogenase maturation protein HypF